VSFVLEPLLSIPAKGKPETEATLGLSIGNLPEIGKDLSKVNLILVELNQDPLYPKDPLSSLLLHWRE